MFREFQLSANDPVRIPRSTSSYENGSISMPDYSKSKPREPTNSDLKNFSEQRLLEIKKMYGIKDKLITEPCEVAPLRQINLQSSNYNTFKNIDQKEKDRSSTVFKSTMIYSSNLKQQTKLDPRREIRESIVRRVDESRDIPRFGGKNIKWQGGNSRSIDIHREERIESIDRTNMRIYQILNLNEGSGDKILQQLQLRNQLRNSKIARLEPCKPQIFKSKVFIETNEDAFSKYYVPGRGSRKIDSIDEKMRRHSTNYTAINHQRSKTPHLLEQSRNGQSSIRHRNFDQQIKNIEQRIKKSNEQKKRLEIFFPEKENIQLPKRILDYSNILQKPAALAERRNRIYSNNLSTMKLKTEQCEKFEGSKNVKQSGRLRTQSNLQQTITKSYQENKNQRYQKLDQYNKKPTINGGYDNVETSKVHLKELVQALRKQVELDESLRNAKVASCSLITKNKYFTIQEALEKQGVALSEAKIQQQFEVTEQEHNPFFSVRQSNKSLDDVIQRYCDSYKHWNNNLFKKFDISTLTKEGFCEKSIDLTKKGQISIEDIVRFLNFETKNFYRNRDIILIFRRITNKTSIVFNELTDVLCKS